MNRFQVCLAALVLVAPGVFGASKDPKVPAGPSYDSKTEVTVDANIVGVREVTTGALQGVFLTVKVKGESMDWYLGPSDFIKLFEVEFKTGAEVSGVGSKVKFEDKDLVLARMVKIGKVELTLREADGTPYWQWKTAIPSGL